MADEQAQGHLRLRLHQVQHGQEDAEVHPKELLEQAVTWDEAGDLRHGRDKGSGTRDDEAGLPTLRHASATLLATTAGLCSALAVQGSASAGRIANGVLFASAWVYIWD